ncbi:MAG: DUF5667 domain-containing protein [Nocardioidaceae bacterium]
MTTVFGVRKRAEEFAVTVDGSPDVTALHPEMRALVGVAAGLRALPSVEPAADFAVDLRARLMAEAAAVLNPENAHLTLPPRKVGARERRLVAVAASVALIGGTAGMAAASEHALPGEALYPIKRGIEQAQAGLSMGAASKGHDLLGQANDRLTEVQGLLAEDSVTSGPRVPDTLDEFTRQANEGASLLFASYRDSHDPAAVAAVRQFAADGMTTLNGIADAAPPEAGPQLSRAATSLRDIDRQASQLCGACAAGIPALRVPPMLLTSAEVDKALRDAHANPNLLDNSHPVVVNRGAVPTGRRTSGKGGKTGGQSGATGVGPSGPAPTTSPQPGGSTVPGTDGPVDTVKKAVKKPVNTVTGGLGDTLGGVETLLPDPNDPLLP